MAAQPALADYAAGWAALENGDYAAAFTEWKPLAETGHANAQAGLGFLYMNGLGVAQDTDAAFEWFIEAANRGNGDAMFAIANVYFFGEGRPQDFAAAYQWYTAAEQNLPDGPAQVQAEVYGKLSNQLNRISADAADGNATAQVVLATRYYLEGDLQDLPKAADWFRRAADQDHQLAQLKLGEMYQFGIGFDLDLVKSHFWYSVSAAQGNAEAILRRDSLAESLDPAQLAASDERLRAWLVR